MNVYDSERMAEMLDRMGFERTPDPRQADLYVVNTCSVREKPRNRVVSASRHVRGVNPDAKILITGCVAQLEGQSLMEEAWADGVMGTEMYHVFPDVVQDVMKGRTVVATDTQDVSGYTFVKAAPRPQGIVRYVTIQKGCDNFCAYCVVPYARGPEVSREVSEIIEESQSLVQSGAREIWLLGQNVNSYRGGLTFPELLYEVAQIPGLERVRFTTSHPKDLSDELIDVMASTPGVCPWIHLPLQSGANHVLDLMGRGYTREHYLGLVAALRDAIPDISITTDVIVGFPGETEKDFLDTYSLVEEVGYEGMYSFKYSVRPGTRAETMPGHLPEHVKQDRLQRLQSMHESMLPDILERKYLGTVQKVLVEGPSVRNGEEARGRTPTAHVVNFSLPGRRTPEDLVGMVLDVEITEIRSHTLYGRLAGAESRAAG